MLEHPLVTAIMPTRGRPQMARAALGCFLAQTYEPKELVIVDDADAPSFPRGVTGPGINYIRLSQILTIGAKRNYACSQAQGEIICHFDSDDWSHPLRIAEQVARLADSGLSITGYNGMYFTDGSGWWKYTAPRWYVLGTSLMYQREAWRARPFTTEQIGEDLSFIFNRKVVGVDAEDRMVAWIHDGNTAEKREELKKAPVQWKYLGEVA